LQASTDTGCNPTIHRLVPEEVRTMRLRVISTALFATLFWIGAPAEAITIVA
jgi:hypothetical protein